MTCAPLPRRLPAAVVPTLMLVVLTWTAPARALTLLPLDLAQLTTGAGHIFLGRVERVTSGRDTHGLPAVWTTFAIDETLKGASGSHLTLKHLGTTFGPAGTHGRPQAGIPRYQEGESVMLFLHPESALGFTSPVGLGQGCFRIRDSDGRRVAENDVGNRNFATTTTSATRAPRGSWDAATATAAPLPLDRLLEDVRRLLRAAP